MIALKRFENFFTASAPIGLPALAIVNYTYKCVFKQLIFREQSLVISPDRFGNYTHVLEVFGETFDVVNCICPNLVE